MSLPTSADQVQNITINDATQPGYLTVLNGGLSVYDSTGKQTISNGVLISTPVNFSVFQTIAQTSPTGSTAKIIFDSPEFNVGAAFNLTNSRFTAPVNGLYAFKARTGCTNTRLYISLYKNGNEWRRGDDLAYSSGFMGVSVIADFNLMKGDYVEAWIFTTSATALQTGNALTYFNGYIIAQAS